LARELAAYVGHANVITERWARSTYAYDAGTARCLPDLVVLPGDRDELSAVAATCSARSVPMVPRGAGTCLSGGPVPVNGGVVVALTRMRRILDLDPEQRAAVVEPGVTNQELQKAARPHGLMFAPDPASLRVSTIGGNIAENAGGPRAFRYGVTRNHVLGLEYVLVDGSVGFTGRDIGEGPVGLSGGGLDLISLLVGSEGTLAFVSRAVVRLVPVPRHPAVLISFFSSMDEAARCASELVAGGLVPEALELLGRLDVALASDHLALGLPDLVEAMLLVQIDGTREALGGQMDRVGSCVRAHGGHGVRWTLEPDEAEVLWTARRISSGLYGRLRPASLSLDVTVPRRHMGEIARLAAEVEAETGLLVGLVGHAGDGNLHPAILFDDDDARERRAAEEAADRLVRAAVEVGGTITGEHGVGVEKRHLMSEAFDCATLRYFRAIKEAFDPRHLLNPGKLLPDRRPGAQSAGPAPLLRGPEHRQASFERTARAVARLESLLGSDLLPGDDEERLARFGLGGAWRPLAVAVPREEAQLAEVLRVLHESRVPAWPIGSGSLVRWAFAPFDEGVAVSTAHLDQLIDLDPGELTVTVGAGLRTRELSSRLERASDDAGRLMYPVDAPRTRRSTIGAEIAINAVGPARPLYGATQDHVLGLVFADPAGNICTAGARTIKDVAGYDVARFLCGTWGAFGIITRATLRLRVRPEAERCLAVHPLDAETAHRVARVLSRVGIALTEVLCPGEGKGAWLVLAGLHGTEAEVEAQEGLALRALKGCGAEMEVPDTARAAGLWKLVRETHPLHPCREWHDGSFEWLSGSVAAPPARVVEVALTFQRLASEAGWRARTVGHLGSGCCDFTLRSSGPDALAVPEMCERLSSELQARVTLCGWCDKRAAGWPGPRSRFPAPAEAGLLNALKAGVDPRHVLAPSSRALPWSRAPGR